MTNVTGKIVHRGPDTNETQNLRLAVARQIPFDLADNDRLVRLERHHRANQCRCEFHYRKLERPALGDEQEHRHHNDSGDANRLGKTRWEVGGGQQP